MIIVAVTLICAWAVSIASYRINDVPWGEFDWPSRVPIVMIVVFVFLWLFRWAPRERRRNVSRKRQLEALLKELEA